MFLALLYLAKAKLPGLIPATDKEVRHKHYIYIYPPLDSPTASEQNFKKKNLLKNCSNSTMGKGGGEYKGGSIVLLGLTGR